MFRRNRQSKQTETNTDNTSHSIRRTRNFLEAVNAAADRQRMDWDGLDIPGKQAFLAANSEEIIEYCIGRFGADYANLRQFNWFIVENEGRAVVYFERKTERTKR